MSVDTKSTMSAKNCQPNSGTHRNKQSHHSSSNLACDPKQAQTSNSNICQQQSSSSGNPNDIEHLRQELDCEKKNRCGRIKLTNFIRRTSFFWFCIFRNHIQCEYEDLKRQMAEFTASVEEARCNPQSKYDALISKQDFFNDTLSKQVG